MKSVMRILQDLLYSLIVQFVIILYVLDFIDRGLRVRQHSRGKALKTKVTPVR